MTKMRLLILGAGPAMPNSPTAYWDKYVCLSRYFSGDIITPVGDPKHLIVDNAPQDFGFHPFLSRHGSNTIAKNMRCFSFTIFKALKIYFSRHKYDVIISPNPHVTAFIAMCIRAFTGAKVLVEVNGNFGDAFRFEQAGHRGFVARMKERVAMFLMPFALKRADMVKLLYSNQLDALPLLCSLPFRHVAFPEFVPMNRFARVPVHDGKYIFLLGYPWYLKGVDLLIRAFNMLSPEFPEHRLKIVGWCPEGREYFENLAGGNNKIELCDPVYYDEVPSLMSSCSCYVLASRTEAMGRVLAEAMACRKPIVASNVGGVPSIIFHGYNGLLFERESVDDLAQKLRAILADKALAKKLGDNGYKYAEEHLSESCYVDNYKKAIDMLFPMKTE
jgi:glycosyltransferase involved in cell wall biosynthesis